MVHRLRQERQVQPEANKRAYSYAYNDLLSALTSLKLNLTFLLYSVYHGLMRRCGDKLTPVQTAALPLNFLCRWYFCTTHGSTS